MHHTEIELNPNAVWVTETTNDMNGQKYWKLTIKTVYNVYTKNSLQTDNSLQTTVYRSVTDKEEMSVYRLERSLRC